MRVIMDSIHRNAMSTCRRVNLQACQLAGVSTCSQSRNISRKCYPSSVCGCVVIACSKLSSELTFENVCLQVDTHRAVGVIAIDRIDVRPEFEFWNVACRSETRLLCPAPHCVCVCVFVCVCVCMCVCVCECVCVTH